MQLYTTPALFMKMYILVVLFCTYLLVISRHPAVGWQDGAKTAKLRCFSSVGSSGMDETTYCLHLVWNAFIRSVFNGRFAQKWLLFFLFSVLFFICRGRALKLRCKMIFLFLSLCYDGQCLSCFACVDFFYILSCWMYVFTLCVSGDWF